MRRCVIAGGAAIGDYERVRRMLREDDFLICCDSGIRHLAGLQREADLIVGDFDSAENPHLDVETIVLPCEKDDTDTVYAVKEAVKRGYEEFVLIGVCGRRLDHTLGNVSILLYLDTIGKRGVIVDDYSEMEVVSTQTATIDESYPFFSLLNISGVAEGITIRNAKYPLENGTITTEYQYGISNEVLPGQQAEVSVAKGKLLLIRVERG